MTTHPIDPAQVSRPLRILIVDDHPLVRAGVRAELAEHAPGIEVVGEAATVDQAIAEATRLVPDVVLLDVHLPGGRGGGGAEVARAIAGIPGLRILALSVSDAAEDVVSVIRAGARVYVTKSITHRRPGRRDRPGRRRRRRIFATPSRFRS